MKTLQRKFLLLAAALTVFFAMLAARYFFSALPIDKPQTVTVSSGMTLRPLLNDLAERGVLTKPTWLYAYARLSGQAALRTGEYAVEPTHTPVDLLRMLNEGRVVTASFTIVPGQNRWQVRDQLADEGWIKGETFDALCDDGDFLKKHDVPGPTCEGYFYPETYTFARGVSAEAIFDEAFALYKKTLGEITQGGRGPLDFDDRQFMTLAAIVEKETGAPDERPRIACVFYNRLRAKPPWPLATDPTVIYAAILADPNFDGNITRYHLRQLENPYNTYKVKGLPPGPIAAAGREAMEAVANPIECGDYFFVSMNNGRHVFCPTLDCHNKAVQKWQIDYFRR